MNLTAGDIVNWILASRKGSAFRDWTPYDIAVHICTCIDNDSLLLDIDEQGNIVGIVTATEQYDGIVHINHLLTKDGKAIKRLAVGIKALFPKMRKLEMVRRGKTRVVNDPQKFIERIVRP